MLPMTASCYRHALIRAALVGAIGLSIALPARAVPSFSRQTGQPCGACHINDFGPKLTAFGKLFKLTGYTIGDNKLPPLSAMLQGSFSHTDSSVPEGSQSPHTATNDNVTFDAASIFYAGRILSNVGAFAQVTYDGVGRVVFLDNTDIRAAKSTAIGGHAVTFGITANNNPGVTDLWNTTPAWTYPFASSPVAPTPAAATLIDGGLGGQVGGMTAYLMWDNLLYLEAGAYGTFSKGAQRAFGNFNPDLEVDGGAPYWRVAIQKDWGTQYLAVGGYGLLAHVAPGRDYSAGTDYFTDSAIDLTYQYLGSLEHIFELQGTVIWEDQTLSASSVLNGTNPTNHLRTGRFFATYTYRRHSQLNVGYFNTEGSTDAALYSGSATGSPDSEGYQVEFDFTPFGAAESYLQPWLNLRLGLQYIGYTRFDGGSSNYDGTGRNASDNNTLLLNVWLLF